MSRRGMSLTCDMYTWDSLDSEPVQEDSRGHADCMTQSYPSDLTDAQWKLLVSLVPPDRSGGRPRQGNIRRVIDAILSINRTGCQWRMLPHDFPNWKLVYYYYLGTEVEHGRLRKTLKIEAIGGRRVRYSVQRRERSQL